MKLLLEGLLVALVLVAELVGLVALATRYTTTEAHPSERGSIAIVASEDGEAYRRVEWDPSSCGAWAVRRNSSESSGVEANSSFSEAEAQEECRIGIRP